MADKKFSAFTPITAPDNTTILVGLHAGDNMQMNPEMICFQKKISLSSAEILNLFSSPKVLIAAPGSGFVIHPLRFIFSLSFNSVAYATNTSLVPKQGSFGWQVNTDILPSTGTRMSIMAALSGSMLSPDVVNASLVLTTNIGNPTAGNSTLDVYVTYQIIKI